MKCEEYIILINMAIDGELSPKDEQKLKEHLDSCPDCRREYEELKALVGCMGKMGEEVPPSLHSSIMEKIQNEKQVRIPFYKTKAFGYAVAACIAVVAAGAFLPNAGNMFAPKMTSDSASMATGADAGQAAPGYYADMAAEGNKSYASGGTAGNYDTTSGSSMPSGGSITPEASDMPTSSTLDTPDIPPSALGTNYVCKGAVSLPEEVKKYPIEYLDGEAYITLTSETEAAEVLKLLCIAGFEETSETELTAKSLELFKTVGNTVFVILK